LMNSTIFRKLSLISSALTFRRHFFPKFLGQKIYGLYLEAPDSYEN
jgi:hypothetical protein